MPRKTNQQFAVTLKTVTASMRPRPDAAENHSRSRSSPASTRGFNEAAARCRGKPGDVDGRPQDAAQLQ